MDFWKLHAFLKEFRQLQYDRFGRTSEDKEDILLVLAKVAEEVGELSEQVLLAHGRQRPSKGSTSNEALWNEIADVIISVAMMAEVLDLSLDEIIQNKIKSIKNKRDMTT